MEYKYETYSCNNGNPTAIITNCIDENIYPNIAEQLYKTREVDQIAVILKIEDNKCTFQLVNGEFCGNACLSISSYMYENYQIKDIIIINKIIDKNGIINDIRIISKYENNIGNLIIPKELFLTKDKKDNQEYYKTNMNGIEHIIIPKSYGNKNEEYAKKEISKLEKKNKIQDILGIIFLENNIIDPYIWINRIKLLQHQQSCLSGSIAALEYLKTKKGITKTKIIQPTGEAYEITIKKNNIHISGNVKRIKVGIIEV